MTGKHNKKRLRGLLEEIRSYHQEKRTALNSVRIRIAMVTVQLSLLGLMAIARATRNDMASHPVVFL